MPTRLLYKEPKSKIICFEMRVRFFFNGKVCLKKHQHKTNIGIQIRHSYPFQDENNKSSHHGNISTIIVLRGIILIVSPFSVSSKHSNRSLDYIKSEREKVLLGVLLTQMSMTRSTTPMHAVEK